ncbi:MAG: fused MFS/spermidine synthase [Caulobacterales bacterium]|nr:fused MFS/spermidine synthase [Caulobacterales bacterium]
MTDTVAAEPPARSPSGAALLYPAAVFASAALVFLVEPMVAKLVLPLLGGSPAVWNTSLAFFQIALLVGYAYAHLLQRLPTVKRQAMVHIGVLVLAALALPLRITGLLGDPSVDWPGPWLLALVQAWCARAADKEGGTPYALYAASNLGSLLALLAYPIVVEPLLRLQTQRLLWTLGYVGFALLMAALAWRASRAATSDVVQAQTDDEDAPPVTWGQRLWWVGLAAIPSSLMMGVTTHLTMDVASAPFLWVVPLALYLLTFILAFGDRQRLPFGLSLFLHAASLGVCVAMIPFHAGHIAVQMAVTLFAFFFAAMVCHQALYFRRPAAGRLTEFYLWMSLGGVVGGGFNAFVAPVIFDRVYEFPLALVLSCLARPWRPRWPAVWEWTAIVAAIIVSVMVVLMVDQYQYRAELTALLVLPAAAAFFLRYTTPGYTAVILSLTIAATVIGDRAHTTYTARSFFGVLRESVTQVPGLGGTVRMLTNGTTLHGAQALSPQYRCQPLIYYADKTPIARAFRSVQARKPNATLAAVGLGAGTASVYARPGDSFTYFEIDPLVVRMATDPKHFSYTTECAKTPMRYVLGDARLTLDKQPDGKFDALLIDAFSSDAVPVHLLTVEAIKGYLKKVKPDGIVILHLSNRNLELLGPTQAAVKEAGALSIIQDYQRDYMTPPLWESSENVVVAARSWQAFGELREDTAWETHDDHYARAWTDDYANLVGALYAKLAERWRVMHPPKAP